MQALDFRQGHDAPRATINRWVEHKTKQKIREIIPSGGLDTATRLLLVNAIAFKGTWARTFRRSATRDEPFHLEDGRTIRTPLVHQRAHIGYAQSGSWQAVDLSYRDGDTSMLVLLPNRKDGLQDVGEAGITRALHECAARMTTCEVDLVLPRFTIEWDAVDLRNHLRTLGMPLAFTRFRADLSGINRHEPPHEDALFLADILHKARVEVSEEGTEAVAATIGVAWAALCIPEPVPTFLADHPFLFAIRDRTTGAILFLGPVADPPTP